MQLAACLCLLVMCPSVQALSYADPAGITSYYAQLCCTAAAPPMGIPVTSETFASTYQQGLKAASALQQQAVKASTTKARGAVTRELMEWLNSMHRPLATALPEDILVFLTQHWLPNHAGFPTATGKLVAAPTSLAGVKSHLAREFELQGRVGDWDPATKSGNPMHSIQIKDLIKGYHNQAAQLGYQKRGAVPLTELEMLELLQHLCSDLSSASKEEQLLLVRDGLIFSLLWQSSF